ncbi:hypothetical protein P152DRAFT_178658 [Eremomyces bilateralis CBS 781.70]|uniref:Large ribosomal subunit protein mL53 n=1 Tax=Eremomyces bilateralis CBS 781.70 TaxID=1392243 RepID=A0A6G1FTF8_9PEZI|nr:uncharacterized protein P152DRAFT_178658 [Eremomyces bilateralis CBS 781.70]KAF1808972.1 hypothetical protein P152DRAFT_178658 [Eremomyces bilateralis CBS 781.70]
MSRVSPYTFVTTVPTVQFISNICLRRETVQLVHRYRHPHILRSPHPQPSIMITRFLTDVSASFNPFSPRAKTVRSFLALLPANARQTMKVNVKVLPRTSAEDGSLSLQFKDGKQLEVDLQRLKIKEVMEEVDRHSRKLGRQAELSDG